VCRLQRFGRLDETKKIAERKIYFGNFMLA